MKAVFRVFSLDFPAKVLSGLAGLALIRYLPPEEYAHFTLVFAFSTALIHGLVTNLNGIYIVGHERLKLRESPQLLLGLELWLLTAAMAVALPFAHSFGGLFGMGVLLTFAYAILEFAKTDFQQRLRFTAFGMAEVLRVVLYVLPLTGLILLNEGNVKAWQVLGLQTAGIAVVALAAFGRRLEIRALLRFQEIIDLCKRIFRSHYRFMIGYFLLLAFLTRMDLLMLEALDVSLALSTYASAFRYYALLMILLAAMHTVYLPLTNRAGSRRELGRLLSKHRRLVRGVIPVILAGAWASEWIIPFIDGGKYPQACGVFRILSISAVISLACSPHANVLFRYEAYRFLFRVVCGAFVMNAALNAVLIPRFHAAGAAWATLAAMGVVNGSTWVKSRLLIASEPLPEKPSAALAAGA